MNSSRFRLSHVLQTSGLSLLLLAMLAAPALAANSIQDDAGMFSAEARADAEQRLERISQETGKTVRIITTPNLGGRDIGAEATRVFQDERLNGVLVLIARDERLLAVKVGESTRQLISVEEERAIRGALLGRFGAGEFDAGLLAAIDRIDGELTGAPTVSAPETSANQAADSGIDWLPIVLVIGGGLLLWMMLRSARRARQSWQAGPAGYAGAAQPGSGLGGGGFFSGLMGGITGVLLGNALFNAMRGDNPDRGGDDQGQVSDSPHDVGGWGSWSDRSTDASIGSWGDGGHDWGSRGGDFGGGDFGGGDMGGSW